MFQLTPTAAITLDEVRRQQQIPSEFGVRFSARPTPEGEVGLHVAFAPEPAETDIVAEQHGTKVFIAQEVAEPLADAALDATASVSADGSSPSPQFTLRAQEPEG